MKKISELGLETIQLEDQVLLVDSSADIEVNDWYTWDGNKNNSPSLCVDSYNESSILDSIGFCKFYKVVASTKPLEGIPLLVIEDEAMLNVLNLIKESKIENKSTQIITIGAYVTGYNKVKETYKFTEEDLANAMKAVSMEICTIDGELNLQSPLQIAKWCANYIQSLTKKELWIEVETELDAYYRNGVGGGGRLPKITNNQIKAVWK